MAVRVLAVAARGLPLRDGHGRGALGRPDQFRLGGVVFLVVTLAALVLVARAAWHEEA